MTNITAESLYPYSEMMVSVRRELHRNPELGFEEVKTAKLVAKALREMGMEVHQNVGGTGVVGVLKSGGTASILLRADMDALPISETSLHGYKSNSPGKMHACGHDGHTAMLLGAASYLSEHKPFSGTVIFLFQPDEEHGRGAQAVLDDELFTKLQPTESYAIHNLPGEPLGCFSTRVGNICTSESIFTFSINARGGHSAMPHKGVDAILVGSQLVQSLQSIVARKLAPEVAAVVSVTEFITDGMRNVLPSTALVKGDTRTRNEADTKQIKSLMQQIAGGIASSHDVSIDLQFNTEFEPTINSAAAVAAAVKAAKGLGCEVDGDRLPMSFSEDFGRISAAIPGCLMLIGNGTEGACSQPLHSSDYDFNEKALPIGAAFWARLVTERLAI